MPETFYCPSCGSPLNGGQASGLCARCLLKRGLETPTAGYTKSHASGAWQPPAAADLASQFADVEVVELLGRGGMGAVYKARQKQLDRVVALKILPPDIGQDPAFADRFTREAKALARLNHPNIVTLYEFGRTAAGLYYFLMEYVDGVNLRRLIDAGRVEPREALAIVPQVCDALQYAHDNGIVHRDIKPENILLDRRGRVKVADFGLAKLTGQDDATGANVSGVSGPAITESGKVVGTPQYMAPEQSSQPGSVDHRADIYALGVVFYQMLTGEMPGKPMELPSHKVRIDVRLDEVVLRALEADPERRYSQASAMKTQVETIAATPGNEVRPLEYCPTPTRLSRVAIAGVSWVLLIVILAVLHDTLVRRYGTRPFVDVFEVASLMLVVAAPFGITILGCVAVWQIRHSAGRIYGLGIGVLDSLFFPLLALDGLILWGWYAALHQFDQHQVAAPGVSHVSNHGTQALAIGALMAVVIDWIIVRRTWRAVRSKPIRYRTSAELRSSAPTPFAPRFSRNAIIGAAWAPLLLIWFFLEFEGAVSESPGPINVPDGPPLWLAMLFVALTVLGLAAPFATTLLGCVAISQIRRSAGRIYGLKMAVFDALVFPLLALDGLIFWGWYAALRPLDYRPVMANGPYISHAPLASALSMLTATVLDWIIVRRTWRAVCRPLDEPAQISQ